MDPEGPFVVVVVGELGPNVVVWPLIVTVPDEDDEATTVPAASPASRGSLIGLMKTLLIWQNTLLSYFSALVTLL